MVGNPSNFESVNSLFEWISQTRSNDTMFLKFVSLVMILSMKLELFMTFDEPQPVCLSSYSGVEQLLSYYSWWYRSKSKAFNCLNLNYGSRFPVNELSWFWNKWTICHFLSFQQSKPKLLYDLAIVDGSQNASNTLMISVNYREKVTFLVNFSEGGNQGAGILTKLYE